jgi:hypothetical protein
MRLTNRERKIGILLAYETLAAAAIIADIASTTYALSTEVGYETHPMAWNNLFTSAMMSFALYTAWGIIWSVFKTRWATLIPMFAMLAFAWFFFVNNMWVILS